MMENTATRINLAFQIILTLVIFSLWAAFALIIVNDLFYRDLPGYQIGRLCIWELVALAVAYVLARILIHKWGEIQVIPSEVGKRLSIPSKFTVFFTVYFLFGVLLACWKYYQFSVNFTLPA